MSHGAVVFARVVRCPGARALAWAGVAALLVLLGCGATVTHVRGPDGASNWIVITCHGSDADCYEAAGEECPSGYVVADHDSWTAGSVSYGTQRGSVNAHARSGPLGTDVNGTYSGTSNDVTMQARRGELVIKCQSRGESAERGPSRAVQREEEQEEALSGTSNQKDYTQCNAAFGHVDDLAALWSEWFHGDALDKPPRHDPFVFACGDLDDDSQLCLSVPYAKGHHDACLALLKALPPVKRQKLDRLLLRSAGAAAQ